MTSEDIKHQLIIIIQKSELRSCVKVVMASRAPVPNKPTVSVDVKQHSTFRNIVQELCESRGGRPGLSVLTSLLVSVDVKNY